MHSIKRFFTHMIANQLVLFIALIIAIIVIIGMFCFHFVEGRGFFDSFYFTTVTMSTIGYGDMAPLTHGGKIISIIYGFMGAPLFMGLAGLLFQSRLHKLVKNSIHAYHKEVKEAENIALEAQKENKQQNKTIKGIQEEVKEAEENK